MCNMVHAHTVSKPYANYTQTISLALLPSLLVFTIPVEFMLPEPNYASLAN